MRFIAIIPARLESTRLPRKVLADIAGLPMYLHVYNQAKKLEGLEVVVATDAQEVADSCAAHGVECVMTGKHASGTDRVAEAATQIKADVIINLQADEPFIEPMVISALMQCFDDEGVQIATLKKKVESQELLFDYNTVKVVTDIHDDALYFSRQAIPAFRDDAYRLWNDKYAYFQHLGIYGFRYDTLHKLTNLDISKLEAAEKLEQLRWLENGYKIRVKEVESDSFGIDTEGDLEEARKRIN